MRTLTKHRGNPRLHEKEKAGAVATEAHEINGGDFLKVEETKACLHYGAKKWQSKKKREKQKRAGMAGVQAEICFQQEYMPCLSPYAPYYQP